MLYLLAILPNTIEFQQFQKQIQVIKQALIRLTESVTTGRAIAR
jgi:hypothetical protein